MTRGSKPLSRHEKTQEKAESTPSGSRLPTTNRDGEVAEQLPPHALMQADVIRIYNRNAKRYDLIEAPMEALLFRRWRPRLLNSIQGHALELGVGTGRNFPYYPDVDQAQVVAVDAAEEMLERARKRRE